MAAAVPPSFRRVGARRIESTSGSGGSASPAGSGKENQPLVGGSGSTIISNDDLDENRDGSRDSRDKRYSSGGSGVGRKRGLEEVGHTWGPFQKQLRTDPLVGHGRHFGRTIRTFCRVQTLISNGLSTTMQIELERITEADLSRSELLDLTLYRQLIALSPSLEERLNTGTDQDMIYVASMITKGIGSARSDDTKSLKSSVVDWITPLNQYLNPPLQRNVKTDRGFFHYRTGELLCPVNLNWYDAKIRRDLKGGNLVPTGDLWPRFLFKTYDYNPQDPWEGLLQSNLLVQAYKHVFTSPSSVYAGNGVSKATRSSNARIHGMTCVTVPSIAYIATQVRFALSSSTTFCRTDHVTDSEYFYDLVIDLLEDPDEEVEVSALITWWNQQVFPIHVQDTRSLHDDSVITKIKERRDLINQGAWPPPRGMPPRFSGRKGPSGGDEQAVSPQSDGEGSDVEHSDPDQRHRRSGSVNV